MLLNDSCFDSFPPPQVEVYDLGVVFSSHSMGLTVQSGSLEEGCFTVAEAHESAICDLSLSPDGGVLATASEDGHLKFWQIDWDTSHEPK